MKNGAETTLVVDRNKRTLRSNGNHKNDLKAKQFGPRKDSDTMAFGDLHSNGYVFVGGLPSWYSEKMDSVVLPTTLLEPRCRGSVRHLKYRDMRSSSERIQDMMAYKVSKPMSIPFTITVIPSNLVLSVLRTIYEATNVSCLFMANAKNNCLARRYKSLVGSNVVEFIDK